MKRTNNARRKRSTQTVKNAAAKRTKGTAYHAPSPTPASELRTCACGCTLTFFALPSSRQQCYPGHRGALSERRRDSLKAVLTLWLIGRGAGWNKAVAAAALMVNRALDLARKLLENEWDYMSEKWRLT